jgi:hypothetical protein
MYSPSGLTYAAFIDFECKVRLCVACKAAVAPPLRTSYMEMTDFSQVIMELGSRGCCCTELILYPLYGCMGVWVYRGGAGGGGRGVVVGGERGRERQGEAGRDRERQREAGRES